MISTLWQAATAAADFHSHLRRLQQRPILDVVFISNMRDSTDRKRFLGNRKPASGHFNGPRIHIRGINARVRSIDSTAEEMMTSGGRRQAKAQFIAATEWARQQGAKVILLAASTKRLFGRDGREIRERFPELIFTIGDNGTALLLLQEVFNWIEQAQLSRKHCRVLVIGPYGILGNAVTAALLEQDYTVVAMGGNRAGLKELETRHGITGHDAFDGIRDIDLVVACTHSRSAILTAEVIDQIQRPGKPLHVIDVAEPSNFTAAEFACCDSLVTRQDAGNAYSRHLSYVLGNASYRLFRLSQGVIFGCFAEALSLCYAHQHSPDETSDGDHFQITPEGMSAVSRYFDALDFGVPSPRNFGTLLTEEKR